MRAFAAVFIVVVLAAGAFIATRTIPAPTHPIEQPLNHDQFSHQ